MNTAPFLGGSVAEHWSDADNTVQPFNLFYDQNGHLKTSWDQLSANELRLYYSEMPLVDRWSLVHFLAGFIAVYVFRMPWWLAILLSCFFEIVESQPQYHSIWQRWNLYIGSDSSFFGDSAPGAAADQFCFTLGVMLAYYLRNAHGF